MKSRSWARFYIKKRKCVKIQVLKMKNTKKKRNVIDDLMKQRERREEKRLTDNCKEAIL